MSNLHRYKNQFILLFILIFLSIGYADAENIEFPYAFNHTPYINPKIIRDLLPSLADSGEPPATINLVESQSSNRYCCKRDIKIRAIAGKNPYVYIEEKERDQVSGEFGYKYIEKTTSGFHVSEEFGYQYIGKTTSGVHVLLTSWSGGGSGVFKDLIFVTIEYDRTGITPDQKSMLKRSTKKRLLIKRLGRINMGDRWYGELRIINNKLFIGKDKGWFSGSPNGGQFSENPKDRVIRIDR